MHHGQTTESGPFVGADASGRVRVEIDRDVVRPRVTLGAGWRSMVPPDGLGPAVLQAFGAATTARLMDVAAAGLWATAPGSTHTHPGGALPAGAAGVELVRRAQDDLAEFRIRLAELSAATRTAFSPDERVSVTIRGGDVVAIDIGRAWRDQARDDDLEGHLADGLRAALALIATTPHQALDGCPYLVALLATAPAALPFTLPEPALANVDR